MGRMESGPNADLEHPTKFVVEQRQLTDEAGRPMPDVPISFHRCEGDGLDDAVREFILSMSAEQIGNVLKFPGFEAVATVRTSAGVHTLQFTPFFEQASPSAYQGAANLALTYVDGAIRLVTIAPDGTIRYIDPCEHLHGLLYVAGAETAAFRQAVEEFEWLVNNKDVIERDLQVFFERHPDFITRDNHKAAHPHVVLERESGDGPLIPDFVLEPIDQDGLADLLELKRPTAKIFALKENRTRYSSAVLEACAQLREYSRYFDELRNRERIRQKYGLLAYRPRMFVIIGRRGAVDPIMARHAEGDLSPALVINTYDDVLERARNTLAKMRRR